MNSEILIYQNPDGNIKINVRLEEETVWLTQSQMGELFGKDKRTISVNGATALIKQIQNKMKFTEAKLMQQFID